jgi:Ca-activated chloride channel family protein
VVAVSFELDKEAGLIRKSPRDKAVMLINKLATETGGRAFFPDSIADLPQIASEIIRDLRTQYVIAYNPTNKTQDGSFRAIKVSVDQPSGGDKRIALTRTGRLARREGAGGSAPKPPTVRLPAGSAKKP